MKQQGIFQSYHLSKLLYIALVLFLFLVPLILSGSYRYVGIPPGYWVIDLYLMARLLAFLLALIPIAYEGIVLLFEKKISTEFFLIIASMIAILGNEISAITIVLFIMLIAHYIEDLVKERTEEALQSLVKLIPSDVLIVHNGIEEQVPIEKVHPGMQVIIKTGGRIPVDGIIRSGEASVQEAFLTGESIPQHKGAGELVYAGTYIEAGSIIIEAQKVGQNTFFSKISELLDEAGRSKAHVVQLADRITQIFTPLFLLFIGLVFLFTRNLSVIITLLVFGSPLELSLVTPLTLLAGIVAAFRRGILVKGGASLEHFSHMSAIIFDKTGTLTMGVPEVISIESLNPAYSTEDVLRIAAIAEKKSGHVLARAILERAAQEKMVIPDPEHYVSVTGHGITIQFQGQEYILGNRHFIEAKEHGNIRLPAQCVTKEALTTFYIATQRGVIGQICLADRIREDAQQMVAQLKARGIANIQLLSGDQQKVADQVAVELGIPKAYGQIMPDEKLRMLKDMQRSGSVVVMVGDGINDAPALRQANVGIALGGMGMEPAIAAADIVLMSGNLDQIIFLYDLSRAAMRTIKQNLIIGFALTHALGIFLALYSLVTPAQAALFHAVSDFLILLNAARLVNFRSQL